MKKLILAVLLSIVTLSVLAGNAYFTGRQQMVQTVSYRMVWQCQYNYNGQTFYRLFEGSCPSNVNVY